MTSRAGATAPAGRGAPSRARAAGPAWWLHPALGPAIVALLLYLPVRSGGFVRDDRDLFAVNPFFRRPGNLGHLLGSDFWSSSGFDSGLWRPLVTLSFWIDGRLGAWLPAWFHTCLLYTSDAADERSSVDLGGRR